MSGSGEGLYAVAICDSKSVCFMHEKESIVNVFGLASLLFLGTYT